MTRFVTYAPDDRLKPFISSFVISESDTEGCYKVLPGTSLVMGFQYRGGLSRIQEGSAISLSASGITGLHDRYFTFKNTANTGTILVVFKNWALQIFSKNQYMGCSGKAFHLTALC